MSCAIAKEAAENLEVVKSARIAPGKSSDDTAAAPESGSDI